MRNVYISRRYMRPIAVGLLLCGLSGFALGQALGRHSAPPPRAIVTQASGALGTPVSTPTPTTQTVTHPPASAVYVPAALAPAAPPPPHRHHKDKHHHDDGDAHSNHQRDHHGDNGANGDNGIGND